MIYHLEEEDVDVLLETTFFIIIHYWPVSNEPTRKRMQELIQTILEKHLVVIESEINRIPSLDRVPDLKRLESSLQSLRAPLDKRTAFYTFAERITHEHSGVVMLALEELVSYLKANQDYLQTSAIGENPDPVLKTVVRALLDCASQYNGINLDIARLCTECIGLVGCIDSNRVEAPREQKSIVVLDNFENDDDRRHFGFYILTEVLVKAFLSATDPRRQGYLSYAIQELLERCDIKIAVLSQDLGSRGGSADIYRKWKELPVSVQEALTPFLNSRYILAAQTPALLKYPIFCPGKSYVAWVVSFVQDLLRRPQNANASLVFEPLTRVTRLKDPSVPEFLLPYVVSHIIVSEDTPRQLREDVVTELATILHYELPAGATADERQDMKLFYEVSSDCSDIL